MDDCDIEAAGDASGRAIAENPAWPSERAVRALLRRAFPTELAGVVVPLEGGRSNASYRVRLAAAGEVVVRIYLRDRASCEVELAVWKLAGDVVPMPEIVFSDSDAVPNAFLVYRYAPGTTFAALKKREGREVIAQAAFETGRALAAVGRHRFCGGSPFRARRYAPEDGAPTFAQFMVACSSSAVLRRRVDRVTIARLQAAVEAWLPELDGELCERRLVHGDFSRSNVVLCGAMRGWRVTAVLDWEFAAAGSPLFDVGHFLRYDDVRRPLLEPHFSRGFVSAGGVLPDDWRRRARILDLAALAGGLTKPKLPAGGERELHGLLCATLAACGTP